MKYLRKFNESLGQDIQADADDYLADLTDDGFNCLIGGSSLIQTDGFKHSLYLRVWKPSQRGSNKYVYGDCKEFRYEEVENQVVRFFEFLERKFKITYVTVVTYDSASEELKRISREPELFEQRRANFGKIKSLTIGFEILTNNL